MLKPPAPFCILNKFHFSSDFELPKFELIHFIFQNLNSQSTGMISDRLKLISTIVFRVLNRLTKKWTIKSVGITILSIQAITFRWNFTSKWTKSIQIQLIENEIMQILTFISFCWTKTIQWSLFIGVFGIVGKWSASATRRCIQWPHFVVFNK